MAFIKICFNKIKRKIYRKKYNNIVIDATKDIKNLEEVWEKVKGKYDNNSIETLNNKCKENKKMKFLDNYTKMIAHRGFSDAAPENTIPAYLLAKEFGFWACETDIQVSKDNVWVVMHDYNVDRMTDGKGNIKDLNLDEIKELEINSGNNVEKYSNLRIPTFEEFLEICKKTSLFPIIEIKSGNYTDEDYNDCMNLIRKYNLEDNSILISFSKEVCKEIRKRSSSIYIQLLGNINKENINFVKKLKNAGMAPKYKNINKEDIKRAHKKGILVNIWNVNNINTANKFIELGVDFITTDRLIKKTK